MSVTVAVGRVWPDGSEWPPPLSESLFANRDEAAEFG